MSRRARVRGHVERMRDELCELSAPRRCMHGADLDEECEHCDHELYDEPLTEDERNG